MWRAAGLKPAPWEARTTALDPIAASISSSSTVHTTLPPPPCAAHMSIDSIALQGSASWLPPLGPSMAGAYVLASRLGLALLYLALRCGPSSSRLTLTVPQVHQIQSSQVIVDLCSVVKELVENSIDAGATIIDVRFKNQGLDLIEVQDNGSGISPANYASVALKHHTSKLSSYSEIASLQTFGFRGEALASLCALSTLTVTTCLQVDVPKGSRLSFEPSGKLKDTAVVAAQRGTTVSVDRLFHNLPVRRRELERNIKREWHKVIALLNQYACIQTNLKFAVSQQPTKGKRILLFSTKGNSTTRDNIINIFGAKAMSALVSLDLALEMQPSSAVGPSLNAATDPAPISNSSNNKVRVVGHVSRPSPGGGRQTPDRQMFFVNGRPCGLPQFAKAFNEVYRSYNYSQSPFIFADIQLDTHMYDVNVSPDKRSILLHDQSRLLDTLRTSLAALFDAHDHVIPVSQPAIDKQGLAHDGQATRAKAVPPVSRTARSQRTATAELQSDDDDDDDDDDAHDGNSKSDGALLQQRVGKAAISSRHKAAHDQNLISQWLNRGPETASQRVPSVSNIDEDDPGSPGEFMYDAVAESVTTEAETNPPGQVHAASQGARPDVPRPVMDFNERLAENASVTHGTTSSPETTSDIDAPAVQPLRLNHRGAENLMPSSRTPKHPTRITAAVTVGHDAVISQNTAPKEGGRVSRENTESQGPSLMSKRLLSKFAAGQGENDSLPSADFRRAEAIPVPRPLDIRDAIAGNFDDPHDCRARSSSANTHPGAESEGESDDSVAKPAPANPDRLAGPEEAIGSHKLSPRAQPLGHGTKRGQISLRATQQLRTNEETIRSGMNYVVSHRETEAPSTLAVDQVEDISAPDAESKLPLIMSRSDFSRMRVVGQFNMGFVIAVRPAVPEAGESRGAKHDELFIIDQHASDEKYNFERLQNTTTVQSQRLVHPRRLQLTALEEEIVMENVAAIEANGFKVEVDATGSAPVGSRCQALALPLSRETTFNLEDLEELISLLGEESSESNHVPRPSKVRKMFAMRACRSSIMIGRGLTGSQMRTLLRHMGELDKPWNCPHGRPTMRHLCRLQAWDGKSWKGDVIGDSSSAWRAYGRGA
ncbi:DNA mismatch repair protein pms1 [Tolypocladium paradoxum]|uniref:DNA mismatch repair protein PMS1 n=1 Tax=Tolypocladium paradoxum TaxID=94208 RepID=A0A2S4L2G8_9HYPO|nr:DNA mismatch repair protein pms1 [Tolypocladium paradoxum]